jgi:hypothetical protein
MFDLPLPLLPLPVRLITPLRTGAFVDLCWICLKHLKRCCTSFSTGATPNHSRMSSFRTMISLCGHKSIIACAYQLRLVVEHRLLVGQHSALYNMADRIAIR